MSKVLITGASGYIASHIIQCLENAGYSIIGTVRSEDKGKKLKAKFKNFDYEIVPDMVQSGAFDECLKAHQNIKYVIHTASPLFYDTTDPENDLIIPAMKGTENILLSIKAHGSQIERVIITSSDAALYSSVDEQNPELLFDETSWNLISLEEAIKDGVAAYYASKSYAEKLAWDFVEKNDVNFKLVAVNPAFVFGPQIFEEDAKGTLNESNQTIGRVLSWKSDADIQLEKGGYVDVRDIAKAHLAGIENPNLQGKRLFCCGGKFSSQMILDIVNENFPHLNLPKGVPGNGVEDIKSLAKTNNDETKKLLGFEFRELAPTVVEVVSQILS